MQKEKNSPGAHQELAETGLSFSQITHSFRRTEASLLPSAHSVGFTWIFQIHLGVSSPESPISVEIYEQAGD